MPTVLALLLLTFALNVVAILVRARMRKKNAGPPLTFMADTGFANLKFKTIVPAAPVEDPTRNTSLIVTEKLGLYYAEAQALKDISMNKLSPRSLFSMTDVAYSSLINRHVAAS